MKAWVLKHKTKKNLYWDDFDKQWDKLYYATLFKSKSEARNYASWQFQGTLFKPIKVDIKEI